MLMVKCRLSGPERYVCFWPAAAAVSDDRANGSPCVPVVPVVPNVQTWVRQKSKRQEWNDALVQSCFAPVSTKCLIPFSIRFNFASQPAAAPVFLTELHMLSIQLGPLAFPLAPLVLIAAALLALWLARRIADAQEAAATESALWWSLGAALLGARVAHVLLRWDAYAAQPGAIFDIRDGGWSWPAGLLAGALVLAVLALRRPGLRRALLAAGLVGVALWGSGQFALQHWGRDTRAQALRSLEFRSLAGDAARSLPAVAEGRPMVVNLWASWCGPCRAELPLLAQAQQAHSAVRFVYVNQGESPETIRAFLAAQSLQLSPVLLDESSALGPAIGSRGLPTTLFLNAQGELVNAHMGLINAAALNAQLSRLGAPRALKHP